MDPKQIESAAYHEAGHMTAAAVQAMPIRATGLHVDLCGNGCADYFERSLGDLAVTDVDQRERKCTIIALCAGHAAQLKFYPECQQGGWINDLQKIQGLICEMHPSGDTQEEWRHRAEKLVDDHWPIIEELAKTLLSKSCTFMTPEDAWGIGPLKRQMPGPEVVELFARHGIRAKIVSDDARDYDSTLDVPHYDSLA
jgi:hypothetical protein